MASSRVSSKSRPWARVALASTALAAATRAPPPSTVLSGGPPSRSATAMAARPKSSPQAASALPSVSSASRAPVSSAEGGMASGSRPVTKRASRRAALRVVTGRRPASGRVDGGPDGPRDEVEDLEHAREIVAAELEHHVGEADPLVLREHVHHRLLAVGEHGVGDPEADAQLDGLEGALGPLGGGAELDQRLAELRGRLGGGVPAVAEGDHPAEGAGAVAAHPDGRVRFLHRLGREAEIAELEELAVEGRVRLGPQDLERAQDLIGLAPA